MKQKTSVLADISTQNTQGGAADAFGINFDAKGAYKGLKLAAKGSGGSVLKLNDESLPYPLKVDGTVGDTTIRAEGTITSLLKFTAMDMQLALRGQTLLAQLFPALRHSVSGNQSLCDGGAHRPLRHHLAV